MSRELPQPPSSGHESFDAALLRIVRTALAEDAGEGDWTTLWTVPAEVDVEASIVAKEPLVVAGSRVARMVFEEIDPAVEVIFAVEDGARVEREEVVARIAGPARAILTAERTALNFLGRLSGIATLTRSFVDAVAGTGARIVDTRKTTPGLRLLEKQAVRAGGGENHRVGLHDMILIKDNHLAAAGGVRPALERVGKANTKGLPVEVEVSSLEELEEALACAPDRILLDNMSLELLAEAVRRAGGRGRVGRSVLEASGNMTLERVRAVAETGVDLISVGALTHSARSVDLSLRVVPGGGGRSA